MKILFISHSCKRNGAVKVLYQICKYLSINRIKIYILLKGEKDPIVENEFSEYCTLLNSLEEILKRISEFDLIYSNTVLNGNEINELAKFNIPICTHVHELDYALSSVNPTVLEATLDKSDFFFACSSAVKQSLIKNFNICKSVYLIYSFINDNISSNVPRSNDGFLRILTIANMDYRKGIDLVLNYAYQEVNSSITKKIHWDWVGDNSIFYKTLITKPNFSLKLHQPNHNPWENFKKVDCYFSLSREDPFPLTTLEALARGIQVFGIKNSGGSDELEKLGLVTNFDPDTQNIFNFIKDNLKNIKKRIPSRFLGYQSAHEIYSIILNELKFYKYGYQILKKTPKIKIEYPKFKNHHKITDKSHESFDDCSLVSKNEFKKNYNHAKSEILISIITPLHNPKESFLRELHDSLISQSNKNWEWILVDDNSEDKNAFDLIDKFKKRANIHFFYNDVHRHISYTTNFGVEKSSGQWIFFVDQDDLLAPNTVDKLIVKIEQNPTLKLIYTDEDKVKEDGSHFDAYHKPDWNPFLLRSQNYICHLLAVSREIYQKVGGLRIGFEGAQDWDLCLRLSEILSENEIYHFPEILYHWRSHEGSTAQSIDHKIDIVEKSSFKTLNDFMTRNKIEGNVTKQLIHWDISYSFSIKTKVTLVIYGDFFPSVFKNLLRKINTDNENNILVELIIPNHWEKVSCNHRRVSTQKSICEQVNGDVIILISSETDPISPDWLVQMTSCSIQNKIGLCGGKFIHPASNRIISCGMSINPNKEVVSLYESSSVDELGDKCRTSIQQNLTVLSPFCVCGIRNNFKGLPYNFTEQGIVNQCIALDKSGIKNVFLPRVAFYKHDIDHNYYKLNQTYKCENYELEYDKSIGPNVKVVNGKPQFIN